MFSTPCPSFGTYCQAQSQLKLRLRLALYPVSDKPPTNPPSHPATHKSSDMELCLNSFSAREPKLGTDTYYTNLIKMF